MPPLQTTQETTGTMYKGDIKKKDWKKVMMFTAVGALVGFGGAYLLDRQRAIYVTPSE